MLSIRVRWAAWRLVGRLRRSLLDSAVEWEIEGDEAGRPTLTCGNFRIEIRPRSVRLLDAIHLYCDDVETWLPLVARIRLRNSVRLLLIRQATDRLEHGDEKQTKPPRSRRRSRHESA